MYQTYYSEKLLLHFVQLFGKKKFLMFVLQAGIENRWMNG